eukprot:6196586-Pleurochrysis_carterae.AAC.3
MGIHRPSYPIEQPLNRKCPMLCARPNMGYPLVQMIPFASDAHLKMDDRIDAETTKVIQGRQPHNNE